MQRTDHKMAAADIGPILYEVLSINMVELAQAPPHQLRLWLNKVTRRIALERKRGLNTHYRYCLNRHIVLGKILKEIRHRLGS